MIDLYGFVVIPYMLALALKYLRTAGSGSML